MLPYLLYFVAQAILLGFYNAYLLADNRTADTASEDRRIKARWHFFGAAIHGCNALLGGFVFGWAWALFVLALFWGLYAGIVHKWGLEKPFFFVGSSAASDRLLWRLYFSLGRYRVARLFPTMERFSATLKITTFVISLILLILGVSKQQH
jgi:hypothetical protein